MTPKFSQNVVPRPTCPHRGIQNAVPVPTWLHRGDQNAVPVPTWPRRALNFINFSALLRACTLIPGKSFQCVKTMAFPRFLQVFHISRAFCARKKRHNIVPSAFRTAPPTKIALQIRFGVRPIGFWMDLGACWALLGRHLASFGELLGGFWPLWGAPWAHLGRFLGALGRLLVGLGWVLGTFWCPGSLRASILEGSGVFRAGF